MNELCDRLKKRRNEMDLTQEALAGRVGKTRATYASWESGKGLPKSEDLHRLARIIGVTPEWLLTGRADQKPPAVMFTKTFPVLPWGQMSGESVERFHTPDEYSPDCFAWRVTGNTMLNPSGFPSFAPGTLILIDPHKHHKSGDSVIAGSEGGYIFRQFEDEGNYQWLMPLNKQHSPIMYTKDTPIHGVIRAAYFKIT